MATITFPIPPAVSKYRSGHPLPFDGARHSRDGRFAVSSATPPPGPDSFGSRRAPKKPASQGPAHDLFRYLRPLLRRLAGTAAIVAALTLAGGTHAETTEFFYPDKTLKVRLQTQLDEQGVRRRHGIFLRYHPNGVVALRGLYRLDVPTGRWSWWDEQGNLIRQVRKDGRFEELLLGRAFNRPTTTLRNTAGTRLAEGLLKNNKRHGAWRFWFRDGTLKAEGGFLNGIPDGKWVVYYRNGQIRRQVDYRLGVTHGFSRKGFSNGQDREKGRLEYGLREGLWRSFYPNGRKKEVGVYRNGRREDEWRLWGDRGRLIRHSVHRNGKVVREISIPLKIPPRRDIVPDADSLIDRPRVFDRAGKEIHFRHPGERPPTEEEKASAGEDKFEQPWRRLRRWPPVDR